MDPIETTLRKNPPTILIVDKDPNMIYMLRRYSESHGYRVVSTAEKEKTLSLAKARQPIAILMEVLLSPANGWDVLAALRSDVRTSAIPVVLYSSSDEAERGRKAGAAGFLCKPVLYSDFYNMLTCLTSPEMLDYEDCTFMENVSGLRENVNSLRFALIGERRR